MLVNYSDLIKQYKKSKMYKTKGKIYISNVANIKCDWLLKFQYDGCDVDSDIDIWDGLEDEIGSLIHQKIQNILLDSGHLIYIEKECMLEIDSNMKIRMKIDGVFADGSLLEIKTVGIKDKGLKEPKKEHIEQLNFYLGMTNQSKGEIHYFLRDNGKPLAKYRHEVIFSDELFNDTLNRLLGIIGLKYKELHRDTSHCRFCNYHEACEQKRRDNA